MKHFYLFGKEACAAIAEENVNGLLEAYENGSVEAIELFVFEDGVTTPTDLLAAFCGNEDYYCLTETEHYHLKNEIPMEEEIDGSVAFEEICEEIGNVVFPWNISVIDSDGTYTYFRCKEVHVLLDIELYDLKSLRHDCIEKYDFDKINELWLNNADITTDTMEMFVELYAELIDEHGFTFESCNEDATAVCLTKKGVYLYFNTNY